MDWPKIKSILIIVLIVTNLMLGFSYYLNRLRFETQVKNNFEDVMKLYSSKEVAVVEAEFEFPQSLRSSNIEFLQIDSSIVQNLLGAGFTFDGEQYQYEDKVVILDDSKVIYALQEHINRVKVDVHKNTDRIDATLEQSFMMDKVMKFIDAYGLLIDFDASEIHSVGDYVVVRLYQSIEGYKLVESITNFWIYKDEVVGFMRENPIKISTVQGFKYDIISVDRALYSLLPKIEQKDTVLDITIVYKLNDESLLVTNLVQGEALPYYQVTLKSGNKFHVRAVETIN